MRVVAGAVGVAGANALRSPGPGKDAASLKSERMPSLRGSHDPPLPGGTRSAYP